MDDKITFNVYEASKKFGDNKPCYTIDVIEDLTNECAEEVTRMSTMESVLRDLDGWSDDEDFQDEEIEQVPEIRTRYYEELGTSESKPLPSLIEPPSLELKPLPEYLKYAYLGNNNTLPIIISSFLTDT